jgi:hypothetical protein
MFDASLECPRCSNGNSSLTGLLISNDLDAQRLRENPFDPYLDSGIDMTCGSCGFHWLSQAAVEGYRETAEQLLDVATVLGRLKYQDCIQKPPPFVPGGILDSLYTDPTKGF